MCIRKYLRSVELCVDRTKVGVERARSVRAVVVKADTESYYLLCLIFIHFYHPIFLYSKLIGGLRSWC